MGPLTGEELAAWVAATCAAQGVAVKVTDARVVARVRILVGGGPGGGGGGPDAGPDRTPPTGATRA